MVIAYKVKKGVNKEKCDDCVLVDSFVINDNSGSVEVKKKTKVMIADGVGGNVGGDEASSFVMNEINKLSWKDTEDLRTSLLGINEKLVLYAKTKPGYELMATTITGIFINDNEFIIAHCGNTRIYSLQGSFLKQITEDQTTYQWLITTGNMEAAEHCNKSEILGAFGGGTINFSNLLVVERIFERVVPTKILMTSDGIHDVLDIDEIEEIITSDSYSPLKKVNMLVDTAIKKGSEDDCTAILIEMN